MAETTPDVPTVTAGEATIPRVGLGTWQMTGQECADIVETALNIGYRHLDTAQKYDNEAMVGEGIAAADVDRSDVFLTTKVTMKNVLNGRIVSSVHESLDRLDVEYVDLLLIHAPHPRMSIGEVLDTMAGLQADGLVRHLGVSNFNRSLLSMALEATDGPLVTDQVQFHPFWEQSSLVQFCREHDVTLTAYSPLDRGRIAQDETLMRIGERYDKTAAQVALRWLLEHDSVVVIPKTTNPKHLEENLAVFDFELTEQEVNRIDALRPGIQQRLKHAVRGALMHTAAGIWRLK